MFVQRHRSAAADSAADRVAATFFLVFLPSQQVAHRTAQQARADAMREFMMDMVEDAEPDESQPVVTDEG